MITFLRQLTWHDLQIDWSIDRLIFIYLFIYLYIKLFIYLLVETFLNFNLEREFGSNNSENLSHNKDHSQKTAEHQLPDESLQTQLFVFQESWKSGVPKHTHFCFVLFNCRLFAEDQSAFGTLCKRGLQHSNKDHYSVPQNEIMAASDQSQLLKRKTLCITRNLLCVLSIRQWWCFRLQLLRLENWVL